MTAPSALAQLAQRNGDLFDEKEAAEFLTVMPGTLSVWRCTGRYAIPFIKVGRNIRYRRADLEGFLKKRTVGNPEQFAERTPAITQASLREAHQIGGA